MAELSCTCGPGESIAGTRQEIVEQRLAASFGLTVPEIHVLLDLVDRALDLALDIPDSERDPEGGEVERLMAQESGRTEEWIKNFLSAWESAADALDRELFEKNGPWGGLFGKRP